MEDKQVHFRTNKAFEDTSETFMVDFSKLVSYSNQHHILQVCANAQLQ